MTTINEAMGITRTEDMLGRLKDKFVTLDTEQTISGTKTFNNVINATGDIYDTGFKAYNTETGAGISFVIGSSGWNRGLYDNVTEQWLLYINSVGAIRFGHRDVGSETVPVYINDGLITECVNNAAVVSQSLGNVGYIKYNNGLIIQWGDGGNSEAGAASGTVTFPISFSGNWTHRVVTSCRHDSDYGITEYCDNPDSFNWTYSGSGYSSFDWIAVGY